MNPVYKTLSDGEDALITSSAMGDLEAFNELVIRYQNMAYHRAYSILQEPEPAEDVTQESFIKAFRSIRSFRGGSFRTWLLKIVTNTAYDLLRKMKPYTIQSLTPENEIGEEIQSPAWLASTTASVEAIVERNETAQRLNQMLDELSDMHRTVITLVDMYGLDYWEAAEMLNVPIGTVKSRLARARLQMREKLREDTQHFYHYSQSSVLQPSLA